MSSHTVTLSKRTSSERRKDERRQSVRLTKAPLPPVASATVCPSSPVNSEAGSTTAAELLPRRLVVIAVVVGLAVTQLSLYWLTRRMQRELMAESLAKQAKTSSYEVEMLTADLVGYQPGLLR